MSRAKYRAMWVRENGPIPIDDLGRPYDIHHIDGNKDNNCIANLQAVSIQDHYTIHYSQGDYGSCWAISLRLDMPVNEREELLKKAAAKRVGARRPDIIGDKNPMRNPEVVKKIRHLLTGKKRSDKQKENCKTAALKQRENKIECEYCSKLSSSSNYIRWHGKNCSHNPQGSAVNRKTNFNSNNPSLTKIMCEFCGIMAGKGNYAKWHGKNCRSIKNVVH